SARVAQPRGLPEHQRITTTSLTVCDTRPRRIGCQIWGHLFQAGTCRTSRCAGFAAVGRHEFSRDCCLLPVSIAVHFPQRSRAASKKRLVVSLNGHRSLENVIRNQQVEDAMSAMLDAPANIPWWKEPTKDQWNAYIAAW